MRSINIKQINFNTRPLTGATLQTGPSPSLKCSAPIRLKMPPKAGGGAAAKARAAATAAAVAQQRKVEHRRERRGALVDLNALTDELGAGAAAVDPRTSTPQEVERTSYIVQARCRELPFVERLRVIVARWVGNGGDSKQSLHQPST